MGCVTQVGEQSLNVGRNAVLSAGCPDRCRRRRLIVSAGRASRPALRRSRRDLGRVRRRDRGRRRAHDASADGPSMRSRLGFPFPADQLIVRRRWSRPQGISAEIIADVAGSRASTGRVRRAQSHGRRRARNGRFEKEILPVASRDRGRHRVVDTDEGIRRRKPREDGPAASGFQARRRRDHGRELISDHRWSRRPCSSPLPRRRRNSDSLPGRASSRSLFAGTDPVIDADRSHPRDEEGPRAFGSLLSQTSTRSRSTKLSQSVVLAWKKRVGIDMGSQRARRRDRARSPARRLRRAAHDDTRQQARADRRTLRPADDVRRRRTRERHDHRAALAPRRAPARSRRTGLTGAVPVPPS